MFCPSCGKENANTFGYCNFCGRPLTPPPGATPPVTAGPAAGVAPAPGPMPAVLNPPKKSNSGVIAVLVIVLVIGLAGGGYLLTVDRESADARIQRLVREAAGLQPEKKAFWPSNRKFDDAFRKDYLAAVKNADLSETSKLGTPDSFADPSTVAGALRQLHAVYDLDMNQEQKVHEVLDDIRNVFQSSDWSESERQGALKGFEQGIAQPMEKRQHAVAAEQAWVAAIDDVYDYATRNHSLFIVNNGQLVVADDLVLQEFKSKVSAMDARRTELLTAKQEFDQFQGGLFQKMGVNPQDVGMQ